MSWQTAEALLPPPVLRILYAARSVDPFTDWNHEKRAIFIHVPKAAGRSIAAALGMNGTDHIPIKRYLAADRSATQSALTFAVLRDPVDRFSSAYHSLRGSSPVQPKTALGERYGAWVAENVDPFDGIDDFVRSIRRSRSRRRRVLRWYHFTPQWRWISADGTIAVDILGDYDRLDDFWDEIRERMQIATSLPAIGQRSSRPPMSEDSADFIRSIYAKDIETLAGVRGTRGDSPGPC